MKTTVRGWSGQEAYVNLLIASGAIRFRDGEGSKYGDPIHPRELCFSAVPLTSPVPLERLVTSLRGAATEFDLLGNFFVPLRATQYASTIARAANDSFVDEFDGMVYLDTNTTKGARNLVTKANLGSAALKSCRGVLSLLATERARRREKTMKQLRERFSDLAGHTVPIYSLATLDDVSQAIASGSARTGLSPSWYLLAQSQSGYERF